MTALREAVARRRFLILTWRRGRSIFLTLSEPRNFPIALPEHISYWIDRKLSLDRAVGFVVAAPDSRKRFLASRHFQTSSASQWGEAVERGDRQKTAQPRAHGRENDVSPIRRVADDGESGQQIPEATPVGRGKSSARRNGRVEHHIDRVRHGG